MRSLIMAAAVFVLAAGGGVHSAAAQAAPAPRHFTAKQEYLTKTKQIRRKTYRTPTYAARRATPQYSNRKITVHAAQRRPAYEIIARRKRNIKPRFYGSRPSVSANVPPLRTIQPRYWK